ncbi:GIN domain-containing protein [Sphingomonas sp. TX0543]|uniref:GIN domain-containing protein n=1 Tax=unclassified Sphingomonas TaxID=196159 RepID=UPI0010F6BCCF|nr:DUF2807 domain-containing protein [Sphingomonas sp. 3P27F8]
MRYTAALALVACMATPALAAERTYSVGSYDRLRVDGPFEVHITAGGSPRASATGSPAILDRLDLKVEGTTLAVRLGPGGWGELPRAASSQTPVVVTLSTPQLRTILLTAGARVTARKVSAQRLDLNVNGSGMLAMEGVEADQLTALVMGTGSIRLAGRANRVRLSSSGAATIDAAALSAADLTVRVDGTGETRASARYTAQVTTTGLGKVTVLGTPKCTVKTAADGPVVCGTGK